MNFFYIQSWNSYVLPLILSFAQPGFTYGEQNYASQLSLFWDQKKPLFQTVLAKLPVIHLPPQILGNGVSFYLGLSLLKENNEKAGLLFFENSMLNDPTPWGEESYQQGTNLLIKNKEWDTLLKWSQQRLSLRPEDPLAGWHQIYALFELGRFEEAKTFLPYRFQNQIPNKDRSLLQTITSLILLESTPQSLNSLKNIIWDNEAGEVHLRIHQFLDQKQLWRYLDSLTAAVLRLRSELVSGRNGQAYQAIRPFLTNQQLYRYAGIWNDLVRVFSRAGRGQEGNTLLTPKVKNLTGNLGVTAWAALGRLRDNLGQNAPARDAFLSAARLITDPEMIDSQIQQAARSAFQIGFKQGLDVLSQASWARPGLYSSLLQRQIAESLQKKQFQNLVDLYALYGPRLLAFDRLNLEWILVRLYRHKFIQWSDRRLGRSPQQMLEGIARFGGTSYPVLMARFTLGLPLLEINQESYWPQSNIPKDPFLWGFLSFGLAEFATQRFNTNVANLDWNFAEKLLNLLLEQKQYLLSIRLITRLSARTDWRKGYREWTILYPLAYWDEIQKVAQKEGLDPLLFLSLVREESLFDPNIHSPVGATGLSQLMPATFREQSRRMGLVNPDIYDPFTNLSIGGNYLSMRLRSLLHPSKALMAYNAGAHRVSTWSQFLDQFPDELMIETIPFFETRNYVKKIISSRMIYASLYQLGELEEAVKSIYPQFSP